jgi:hypothetical protein
MKKQFILLFILFPLQAFITNASANFNLIENNKGAVIHYKGNEKVVKTALEMLIDDSRLVCEIPVSWTDRVERNSIIVGIPDKEPTFKELVSQHKIDISDIQDKWEAFKIVESKDGSFLFIIGSDSRGAAYGVLELSRRMGVSPWVWWADVAPAKRNKVQLTDNPIIQYPSVQYRGIFLNDEDWGLRPWSSHTFEPTPVKGRIGPKTYSKIFELLLRLRANTIWPAMHEGTIPFFFVEGNKETAEKYGIVLSTSHAEPMMRTNTGEWDTKKYGAFNFITNREQVLTYWEERIQQLTRSENIYTVGMRGIHDGRMQGVNSLDDETQTLHKVIGEQRNILKRNNPGKEIDAIPQIFVPYKEVQKAYDNGLLLPDDVTLVWCDDNHGHIMRLSNDEEKKRSGGAGVYYHISYWGKPHDYLWLGSTQPGLIYAEMKRAWDNGARRLWIVNAGDIKPNEYLTEFFLDMAWNIDTVSGNTIYAHQNNWVKTVFDGMASERINSILKEYYRLAGQRKPEHMGWSRVEDGSTKAKDGLTPVADTEFSPIYFGDEIEQRINAYDEIVRQSEEIYANSIPQHLKPAYFQLVHYPVTASAAMNRKLLYAQKVRLYAGYDPSIAREYARKATEAYNEIVVLDAIYNKDMLGGKWDLMMNMKPRNLPVFQRPDFTPKQNSDMLTLPAASWQPASNRYAEHDRMIALNACEHTNTLQLETIQGLGHSGNAVRLPAVKTIDTTSSHLEFKVSTVSSGDVKIKAGVIPMHPANSGGEMRYALVIDNQKPQIISARADFLTSQWAENVLRNQSLIVTNAYMEQAGEHIVRIYALDEEMIFDQLMLEFNPDRKHYLIPAH